jgi:hypothetical protein
MNRQPLENGEWFDIDAAKHWEEDTYFDGNNHISCATGSQWEHQTLYRTAKKSWVLHSSREDHARDTWVIVDATTAAQWLVTNNHDTEEIPTELHQEIEKLER